MSILIKNIQLIDGTGQPPRKADVLIRGDKISAIGTFPRYQANELIDGMGAYLSPGFIDINTDSDHYLTLFSNPNQKDFLLQGVTTIIGGQCGASLAPLLYGSLETIKPWADVNKINVNWHGLGEFLRVLGKSPLGVNFGTLVGHATIREALAGRDYRDLSKKELAIFTLILEKSLKEGGFGFSTGLGYFQAVNTPYSELRVLVNKVGQYGGIYATHLRSEKEGLLSSIEETIRIAKETGVTAIINHFRPLVGFEKEYDEALALIDKNAAKVRIFFDIYPFDTSVVLLHSFLPGWVQKESKEEIIKDIKTPGLREKIIKELPRLGGEEILIISAPQNEYLVGKSLGDYTRNRNLKNLKDGLLSLIELTKLRAVVLHKNINFKKLLDVLKIERTIIASNGTSFKEERGIKKSITPERFIKTFPRFLELSEKENILPLEKAVYKITALPAQELKIKNRGLVREGYFADLVIFKDAKIREVILNGKHTVKEGEFQNILTGKVIKRE